MRGNNRIEGHVPLCVITGLDPVICTNTVLRLITGSSPVLTTRGKLS